MTNYRKTLLDKYEIHTMPKGWKVTRGTLTQPLGYLWVDNGKSIFDKDEQGNSLYQHALIKADRLRG